MRQQVTVRPLFLLARLVGFAGANLAAGSAAVAIVEAIFLFVDHVPGRWNFGLLPLILPLQVIVGIWVVWSIFRRGPRPLLRVLLWAGGVSFLGLYGWYFLIAGEGSELIGIGNLLYLAAGSLVTIGVYIDGAMSRRVAG